MRRTFRTCLLSLLLAVCPVASSIGQQLPVAKPEDVGVSSEKLAKITDFNRKLVADQKIAGAVTAVARRGKVVFLETAGMMDREAGKPMRPDTIFRIASMTKPIASVAVMMLCEEGKLQLTDPLSKFIPEFKNPTVLVALNPMRTKPAKREITIRDLLAHTSGFTFSVNTTVGTLCQKAKLAEGLCQENGVLENNIKKLAGLPLLFTPGDRWEYGTSTEVLGRLVEVVSGMTFDEFLKRRIFRPLKMNDTHFFLPAEKVARLATVYRLSDVGRIERVPEGQTFDYKGMPYSVDYPYRGPRTYFSGNAGLCSTVPDYLRFCQMTLNKGELNGVRLLKSETVSLMTSNQIGNLVTQAGHKFGLGFEIVEKLKEGQPKRLLGKCGWGGFFSTTFCIVPQSEWIFVSMSQVVWNDHSVPWAEEYQRLAADAVN